MTGDARGEAEAWLSEWDRWAERKPALVVALAAAMEVYDSRRMLGTEWGEYKVEVDRFAWERLGDALSALRARAGEEP